MNTERFDLSDLIQGDGHATCFLCDKKLRTETTAVHMSTSLEAIPASEGDDVPDSQGHFLVGSECIKKIPAAFRIKLERKNRL